MEMNEQIAKLEERLLKVEQENDGLKTIMLSVMESYREATGKDPVGYAALRANLGLPERASVLRHVRTLDRTALAPHGGQPHF